MVNKIYIIFTLILCVIASCTLVTPKNNMEVPDVETQLTLPNELLVSENETDGHVALVRRISMDADGRYLVTGSDDKTVRVWDANTGEQIKVLRPPIDQQNEGKIYAVAISPDGNTIACGGWTGLSFQKKSFIYLFDRQTGRIFQKLEGLSNVVNHLSYSPYGQYLVAGFGGKNGICVYRTLKYSLLTVDRNYGAASHGADFSIRRQLVTTCYDGKIRLYNSEFNLIKTQETRLYQKPNTPIGKPHSVHFSPDGSQVAVGFANSPVVQVYSADDLEYLFSANTLDIKSGDLACVAWSRNGKYLYAGGSYHKNKRIVVRRFTGRVLSSFSDIRTKAFANIQHILPFGNDGYLFAASGPVIEAFKKRNDPGNYVKNMSHFFYRHRGKMFISNNGWDLGFEYINHQGKQSFLGFSAETQRLSFDKHNNLFLERIVPANTITNSNIEKPYLVVERNNQYLAATNESLYMLSRDGNIRWKKPYNSKVLHMNISGNGSMAVVVRKDGIVYWHSAQDGKELLAFSLSSSGDKWTLWHPQQGFYIDSLTTHRRLGTHSNSNWDREGTFRPISAGRRSDLIREVVTSGNIGSVMDRGKYPLVEILSPKDYDFASSREVTLEFTVDASFQKDVDIKYLVDGIPKKAISQKRDDDLYVAKLAIEPRDSTVFVYTEGRESQNMGLDLYSLSSVRLKWDGNGQRRKNNLYLLALGVNNYDNTNGLADLEWAEKDARNFVKAIEKQGSLYNVNNIVAPGQALTGSEVTPDNVNRYLQKLKSEWQKSRSGDDVVIIFLSGHGETNQQGQPFFLGGNSDGTPEKNGIAFAALEKTAEELECRVVMFIDTCRSGKIYSPGSGLRYNSESKEQPLQPDASGQGKSKSFVVRKRQFSQKQEQEIRKYGKPAKGIYVFTSCTGGGTSYEYRYPQINSEYSKLFGEGGNGAFTRALVEGIMGLGNVPTNSLDEVTIDGLAAYISTRIPELEANQIPATAKPYTVPNFSISKIK